VSLHLKFSVACAEERKLEHLEFTQAYLHKSGGSTAGLQACLHRNVQHESMILWRSCIQTKFQTLLLKHPTDSRRSLCLKTEILSSLLKFYSSNILSTCVALPLSTSKNSGGRLRLFGPALEALGATNLVARPRFFRPRSTRGVSWYELSYIRTDHLPIV